MNSPALIQHPTGVKVGDLVVVPGTKIRYPIVAVQHSDYSTDIRYDRGGVTVTSCISEQEMMQITPA
jgi:hypothetical protein